MRGLNIGLLQTDIVWKDIPRNLNKITEIIAKLPEGLDIIILPEVFATGFIVDDPTIVDDGSILRWMTNIANTYNCVIIGSVLTLADGNYYNRLHVVGPNQLYYKYDKAHLFTMAGENQLFSHGRERITFSYNDWQIAPMVCYDLRFPVWARNCLKHNIANNTNNNSFSYDVLIYVANWPQKRITHWNTLLRARAIENQAYVIGVNRTGVDGNGLIYNGSTTVVDYLGEVVLNNTDSEICLQITLDKKSLIDYRESFPVWKDADNFQIVF